VVVGLVIVGFLALYNLLAFPLTWFDEGSHLHVPKTLVQHGVYADYSHDGFRYFGPTVGVGPTVLLPIAAVFEVFGIGLLQARLVMVAFLVAAIITFFRFAQTLGGWRFAWVATALLVATRGIALLEYGRQVLGEVPGLMFMAAGLWVWFSTWERSDWRRLMAVGLLLGAAMVTKSQYFIVLAPALLFAWVANAYYRSAPQRIFLVPGAMAAVVFVAWQAYLIVYLGPATAGENWRWYRAATAGAALVFASEMMQRSLSELFSPKVYFGLLLPVVAYGFKFALPRNCSGHQWGTLCVLIAVNLIWYATASIGWLRYAFPALCLAALFFARIFTELTGDFQFDLSQWRSGKWSDVRAPHWQPVWGMVLTALIVIPFSLTLRQILWPNLNAPLEMAKYMETHVSREALVATWEQEMGFLTDHRYAYPPQALLPKAVNHVWADGPGVDQFYSFKAEAPEYVLVGRFATWVDVYPQTLLDADYTLLTSVGDYRLYQAKR
jgi:hypothetical protein